MKKASGKGFDRKAAGGSKASTRSSSSTQKQQQASKEAIAKKNAEYYRLTKQTQAATLELMNKVSALWMRRAGACMEGALGC